ncbi:MAG TPA: NAD(P)/FAD-dependent oxidoreductase [Candidatus Angelobacter sp.]|jgi:kynurenine 3-monooxygenase
MALEHSINTVGIVGGARVAIVGGGPAGSLLALALAQRGYEIDVYERRTDVRRQITDAGRSINLGLSKRGMQALQMVGLLDQVLQRAVTMRGRVIHALDGIVRFQPYGKSSHEVLHSIDRNELNRMLLEEAEQYSSVKLHFEHQLVRVDKVHRELEFEAAGQALKISPAWVIAADGAFSTTRRELQHGERAEYHQEFLEWGYKELTLRAGHDGASQVELDALHLWPRSHCLIVSHPNRNGSHTLTLFLPFEGEDSFATARNPAEVEALFAKYFPDLIPLLPDLVEQWMLHSPASLVTTRTAPWAFGDWAVLVGDACHAVYPFYGQGMNSAFEDCSVLMQMLDQWQGERGAAFQKYELARRAHTDILCELSKANFVELRQKVQSPWFLARKRLDLEIHRLWPEAWIPLYTMIAHTTIPYGEALERSRRQERILLFSSAFLAFAAVGTIVVYMLVR